MQQSQGDSLDIIIRLARANERTIKMHEHACPARRLALQTSQQPAEPIVFTDHTIPYDTVIQIIERMSTQGLDVYQASEEFGFPPEVIELELAKQKGRYRGELLRRAAWRRHD